MYIVSAGEEPSFLTPFLRSPSVHEATHLATDATAANEWRSVPLATLVRRTRGAQGEAAAKQLAARQSRLYIVPHTSLFPRLEVPRRRPAVPLPTHANVLS